MNTKEQSSEQTTAVDKYPATLENYNNKNQYFYYRSEIRNISLQTAISCLQEQSKYSTSDFNGNIIPLARVIESYLLNG
jgi:hypothetical protein